MKNKKTVTLETSKICRSRNEWTKIISMYVWNYTLLKPDIKLQQNKLRRNPLSKTWYLLFEPQVLTFSIANCTHTHTHTHRVYLTYMFCVDLRTELTDWFFYSRDGCYFRTRVLFVLRYLCSSLRESYGRYHQRVFRNAFKFRLLAVVSLLCAKAAGTFYHRTRASCLKRCYFLTSLATCPVRTPGRPTFWVKFRRIVWLKIAAPSFRFSIRLSKKS